MVLSGYLSGDFDAEHLGIALAEKTAPSERILLCRAEKGSPALTERFVTSGAGIY